MKRNEFNLKKMVKHNVYKKKNHIHKNIRTTQCSSLLIAQTFGGISVVGGGVDVGADECWWLWVTWVEE